MEPSSTPLWLVTGFLGSGKTTLMQRILSENRERRLAYLVNEFSAVDVDARLLSDAGAPEVLGIPGGSIFCRCLVTEFVDTLRKVLEIKPPVEGVVIEASGMADPSSMGRMLAETGLDAHYRVASITSLADPATFLKLRQTLPNITAQIEAADTVLLNKVDLATPEEVDATEREIRAIKPNAHILRCTRAVTGFPALQDGTTELDSLAEYAKCKDPHYRTQTVAITQHADSKQLRTAIEHAADHIYRLKGYVPFGDASLFVDFTPAGLEITPVAAREEHALIFILPGETSNTPADDLIASLQ